MVKGGRKAQLRYLREWRRINRDKIAAHNARKGIHYSRVIILGVKSEFATCLDRN